MSRNVRIVLLCEDRQHEVFVGRFLKEVGWNLRDMRVRRAPKGRGPAEQYVRECFPGELRAVRSKRGEEAYLILMVDGDNQGSTSRMASLERACIEQQVDPPSNSDQVLVCVPTWNIETWLAYLEGEEVEESKRDYPRLDKPSDCSPHVRNLAEMCRNQRCALHIRDHWKTPAPDIGVFLDETSQPGTPAA